METSTASKAVRGRGGWVLPTVSAAQLLVVLDGTIVNIALPSAQADLGMSDGSRHWVVTAYLLAFGGLLLIGGRLSGALGHRRAFAAGLIGFAAASALGGAAVNSGMLFGARALQGAFAALLAPAGLSLLTLTFTRERERGRAFGVFAAVGAAGSAVGLIAGGVLTEYADWRWCLYVNVPVALLAALGTTLVPKDRPTRAGRLDVPGALLSAAGFAAVVYACNEAEPRGWGSPVVLTLLAGGLLLLAAFCAVEARSPRPLLPLHMLLDRTRAAAFTSIALMFVAVFGFYLFMSYYAQTVLGYTPVQTGLTLLINAIAAIAGSTAAGRLYGRVKPGMLIVTSLILSAAGVYVLTRLTAETTHVLPLYLTPALVLTGLGLGCILASTAGLATAGLPGSDIGTAAAAYNASQQLGAALGTALFNTVAASATATYLATAGQDARTRAAVHGYTTALAVVCGILLATALLAAVLSPRARTESAHP
ncbi:MFS transporter [Streptomyces sp. NPDC004838]